MSGYADDVTVIVLDISELEMVGANLKEHEALTRAATSQEKSMGLQFGT